MSHIYSLASLSPQHCINAWKQIAFQSLQICIYSAIETKMNVPLASGVGSRKLSARRAHSREAYVWRLIAAISTRRPGRTHKMNSA